MNKRTTNLVRQVCDYVKSVVKAVPEATHTRVLLQLEDQMDCLLRKRKFREAEEMAYAILLMNDSFSKKIMKGSSREQ